MTKLKFIFPVLAFSFLSFSVHSFAWAEDQSNYDSPNPPVCPQPPLVQPPPPPNHPPLPPPHDPWLDTGISLQYLNFWYTGPGCFVQVYPSSYPNYLVPVLQQGAVFVETTEGVRIMAPFDPIRLTRFSQRNRLDDMIAATPWGVGLFQRYNQLPQGAVEVFQRPPEAGLCRYGI